MEQTIIGLHFIKNLTHNHKPNNVKTKNNPTSKEIIKIIFLLHQYHYHFKQNKEKRETIIKLHQYHCHFKKKRRSYFQTSSISQSF